MSARTGAPTGARTGACTVSRTAAGEGMGVTWARHGRGVGALTWTSTDFFATNRAHASARSEVSTEETPRMRGGLCGPAAWAALSAEEDAE